MLEPKEVPAGSQLDLTRYTYWVVCGEIGVAMMTPTLAPTTAHTRPAETANQADLSDDEEPPAQSEARLPRPVSVERVGGDSSHSQRSVDDRSAAAHSLESAPPLPGSSQTLNTTGFSRSIKKQGYGKMLSHLYPEWNEVLEDRLLVEHITELRYSVVTAKARYFRIENSKLRHLKQKIAKFKEDMVVDQLLRELIAEYSTSSRTARDALRETFVVREFSAGVDMFREGAPNDSAYLVVSGEIRLWKKSKLPGLAPDHGTNVASLAKQGPPNSFRIPTKEQAEKPKDSLDRNEARTYVLGVRAPKTWVGEEVIFVAEHQPFHYTATCDKATTALQISRTDMFETLGRLFPDYMNALLKRTQVRYRMHKQRR